MRTALSIMCVSTDICWGSALSYLYQTPKRHLSRSGSGDGDQWKLKSTTPISSEVFEHAASQSGLVKCILAKA
uniref:Uncharacterized protein n=1 Tax=Vitis vinifera TaxID=29760 RepID=F6H5M3_VITVI